MSEMELVGGVMEFSQDGNCCDGGFEILKIHVKDGGGGKFLVLETKQWATSVDELVQLLKKVESAFGLHDVEVSGAESVTPPMPPAP